MSRMLCATLCHTIVHATMCQLSRIGSIFGLIYRIFTTCIWDVSSHIVNVMLYCLICLSFFKYHFDEFRPLSMCSRPYISVFEITEIPASFSFPKIPYRFHFRWKKYESENGGVFRRSFPTVFIPSYKRVAAAPYMGMARGDVIGSWWAVGAWDAPMLGSWRAVMPRADGVCIKISPSTWDLLEISPRPKDNPLPPSIYTSKHLNRFKETIGTSDNARLYIYILWTVSSNPKHYYTPPPTPFSLPHCGDLELQPWEFEAWRFFGFSIHRSLRSRPSLLRSAREIEPVCIQIFSLPDLSMFKELEGFLLGFSS